MSDVIPRKTEEELKTLALDIFQEKVFTTLHIPENEGHMIRSIFMPIGLGGLTPEQAAEVGMLYEYLSQAGPRSVNGYPCFFSVQCVNKADMDQLIGFINQYKEAVESV